MPPYADEAAIVSRYSADTVLLLADRDRDGTADAGVVAQALDDATAEIDSYLVAVYQLPLTEPFPNLLVWWAVDIAVYKMAADCAIQTKEHIRRYEAALAALLQVRQGKRDLGIPTGEPPSQPSGRAHFQSEERVFTRDTLKGF